MKVCNKSKNMIFFYKSFKVPIFSIIFFLLITTYIQTVQAVCLAPNPFNESWRLDPNEQDGNGAPNNPADWACCVGDDWCVKGRRCYPPGTFNDTNSDGIRDYVCVVGGNGYWRNVDYQNTYCTAYGCYWNIGGGDADSEPNYYTTAGARPNQCRIGLAGIPSRECCCGDDANEFYKINPSNPSIDACCNSNSDCVNNIGVCVAGGTESIAQGNCGDGIDNNCNGEDDWDTEPIRGNAHGDIGCPVGVMGVPVVSNLNPLAGSTIDITCTVNAGNVQVNSIFAYIDNDRSGTFTLGDSDCGWTQPPDGWISNTQVRFVGCSVGSAGNKNVACGVYSPPPPIEPDDRSYQAGNDVVRAITVGSSTCSDYTTPATCPAAICKWVDECRLPPFSQRYGGDIGRCVPQAQVINYDCGVKCGEQCEGSNFSNCIGPSKTTNCSASRRWQTRAPGCDGATCLCTYTPWSDQSCTLSKNNCGATCGTGETMSGCTTPLGYPGTQNCNESNCNWNATCYSNLICGDGMVNGTEQCDFGLLQPTQPCIDSIGKFCNSTCQNQTALPENICNDGIDNDCDGAIDGCDTTCFEGWSNDRVSENKRCCADGGNNDPPHGLELDTNDRGCCDLCTGRRPVTLQIMIFANNTFNSNYFGDSCGVNFSDWQTYNGGSIQGDCCGNNDGEYYKNITVGPITRHACCNSTLSCVNQTGACQIGIENTIALCTNDKDDDCDGLIDVADTNCTGFISGHVYDERLNPIMGAIVKSNPPGMPAKYQNQSLPTNYRGEYTLRAFMGNYSLIARKEGYDDNVTFLTINSNSVINNLNFVLRNGSCHADCTDYYGNCNPACNGTTFNTPTGLHTCNIVTPECYYRPKGFRATKKTTTYEHDGIFTVTISQYTCCEGTAVNYTARKATVTGNVENLVISSYKVKKGEEIIQMKIAYWKNIIK